MIMFALRCLGDLCALCPDGFLTKERAEAGEQTPLARHSLASSDYGVRAPPGRLARAAVKNNSVLLFGVPVQGKLYQLLASLATLLSGLVGFAMALQWLERDAQVKDVAKFQLLMSHVRLQLDNETLRALRPYFVMDPEDPSAATGTAREELARTIKSWSFFSEAMYFCFSSVTTIGFGEMEPRTTWGKVCTIVMIATLLPAALSTYIHLASYVSELLTKRALVRQNHFQAVVAKYGKGQGVILSSELKHALHELGVLSVSDEEVNDLMARFDTDGNHVLDMDEFVTLAINLEVPVGKLARSRYKVHVTILLLLVYALMLTLLIMRLLGLGFVDASYWSVTTLFTVGSSSMSPGRHTWVAVPVAVGLGFLALLVDAVAERARCRDDESDENDDMHVAPHRVASRGNDARQEDIEGSRTGRRPSGESTGDAAAIPPEDSSELLRVQ